MSYTVPTINSSAQTWAQLGNRGVEGFVNAVLTSNSATQAQINRTHQLMQRIQTQNVLIRLNNVVDAKLAGRITTAQAKTEVLEINYAYKAINEAIEEIGVLIDAN